MKLSWRNIMTGLGTTLFLAACGGGGGGDDTPAPVNPPVAVATADQTSVAIGTLVTLDGSASSTPNNGTITYQWSLSSKPEGSAAELSSATEAKPSFTPDVPGDYAANLQVNDGTASAAARVTITATNPNPVAIINPASQGVLLGSTVTLDGSNSLPPTGVSTSELSYEWKLTERPEGDTATLNDATSARASFTASTVGIYRATLVVSHGDKTTAPVEAVITVSTGNSRPIAKVTVSPANDTTYDSNNYLQIKALKGQTLVLDGSESSDPDGDTLHYRWVFPTNAAIPAGTEPSITNATNAKAEFIPQAAGTYTIDFIVYDGSVSTTQRIVLTVSKDPADASNTAPVAAYSFASGGTSECELGGSSQWNPNCTLYAMSYDVDGDPLTHRWTYWNAESPDARQNSDYYSATIPGTPAGTWHFELISNDGKADSAPLNGTVTIKTGANRSPVAVATPERATVLVGEPLIFDGSGSTDADGDKLSYQWTLTDRPDGSSAVLQDATSARASIVADKPGIYTAFLQVSDGRGGISGRVGTNTRASAFAKLINNPPVVASFYVSDSSFSKSGALTDTVVIYPSPSFANLGYRAVRFDPDLDQSLDYILTLNKAPAQHGLKDSLSGSQVGATAGGPGYVNLNGTDIGAISVSGDYEWELMVSDGTATSEPKRLSFTAVERDQYQGVLLELNSDFIQSQVLWPFRTLSSGLSVTYSGPISPSTTSTGFLSNPTNYLSSYRLTAIDRDYTIADLKATSTDSAVRTRFEGLQDGQIIRKGETVAFFIYRDAMPDEAATATAYGLMQIQQGITQAEIYAERDRMRKIFDSYQFHWSFRIAEKEGNTFLFGYDPQ